MSRPESDVLKVFWHRGRKEFVPMTNNEGAAKAGMVPEDFKKFMQRHCLAGRATGEIAKDGKSYIYDLTDQGHNSVRIMIGLRK